MNKLEIKKFINKLSDTSTRNIVILDFANVDRWQNSLGWAVGIKQLGQLIKNFAAGKKYLRRFYYGIDYGPKEKNDKMYSWSETIHKQAQYSNFEIVSKRVKYIPDKNYSTGYIKKCNLDIEIAVDLMKEYKNYDTVILFSGDGDFAYLCDYLHKELDKTIYVFGARDHIGKELIDAKKNKVVKDILFVEDFEYRLNLRR